MFQKQPNVCIIHTSTAGRIGPVRISRENSVPLSDTYAIPQFLVYTYMVYSVWYIMYTLHTYTYTVGLFIVDIYTLKRFGCHTSPARFHGSEIKLTHLREFLRNINYGSRGVLR